jgi:DHA2 family multidrug resistance protein-like MFS transporter
MTETAPKAGGKEWAGLAVLSLPCLLVSMDIGVMFFALPFISGDLKPTGTEQLWIIDTYGFVLAGLLITMGAVGDRIGRRKLLLIGSLLFGLASIGAAWSGSPAMLIIARALLGLAGATLMPSTLALIRNMFLDPNERKVAIGAWTGAMVTGITLGPIIGGLLVDHFWWGSVFLINVPVMVLLLIIGPIMLPEYRAPQEGRFDVLGAILSLAAVLGVMYGVKQLAVEGWSMVPAGSLVIGLVLGVLFVRRQQTYRSPLLETALFRDATFSTSILIKAVTMFGLTGISLFTNQYLQLVLGLRPFTAALWSLAVFPAIAIAMSITGVLAQKVKPVNIIGVGLLIMVVGFVVLSLLIHSDSRLWVVLVGAGAAAVGMLMTSMVNNDMVLSAAPPERAGIAGALSETSDEFGSAVGLAILGTVGTAIYHREMLDAALPPLSPAALEAAGDTLGGASAVAANLGGDAGGQLLDIARTAFTQGMNWAAALGGAVVAITTVIAVVYLRKVPAPPQPEKEDKKTEDGSVAAESATR